MAQAPPPRPEIAPPIQALEMPRRPLEMPIRPPVDLPGLLVAQAPLPDALRDVALDVPGIVPVPQEPVRDIRPHVEKLRGSILEYSRALLEFPPDEAYNDRHVDYQSFNKAIRILADASGRVRRLDDDGLNKIFRTQLSLIRGHFRGVWVPVRLSDLFQNWFPQQ